MRLHVPPRSPQYNPVEWVFAYIKRIIRHQAPAEGYTQNMLEQIIHRAFSRITPDMIKNWVHAAGYGRPPHQTSSSSTSLTTLQRVTCSTDEDHLPKSSRLICATP